MLTISPRQATRARNVNLFDTVADDRHRLKIVGLCLAGLCRVDNRIMVRALWKVGQLFEQVTKEGHAIVRSYLIGYNKQAVQPTSRVGPWPTLPQLVFRPMLLARQA